MHAHTQRKQTTDWGCSFCRRRWCDPWTHKHQSKAPHRWSECRPVNKNKAQYIQHHENTALTATFSLGYQKSWFCWTQPTWPVPLGDGQIQWFETDSCKLPPYYLHTHEKSSIQASKALRNKNPKTTTTVYYTGGHFSQLHFFRNVILRNKSSLSQNKCNREYGNLIKYNQYNYLHFWGAER